MADISVVKAKGKWKKLKLDSSLFPKNEFPSSLSCIHELTDYEIINKPASKSRGKSHNSEVLVPSIKKPGKQKPKSDSINSKQQKEILIDGSSRAEKQTANKAQKKSEPKTADGVDSEGQVIETPLLTGKKKKKKNAQKKKKELSTEDTRSGSKTNKSSTDEKESFIENVKSNGTGMSNWQNLFVPGVVLKALQEQGFSSPTPIQGIALPHAIRDRLDIVGAAETGSGKTLAFGIPLIHKILDYKQKHRLEQPLHSDDGKEGEEESDVALDIEDSDDDDDDDEEEEEGSDDGEKMMEEELDGSDVDNPPDDEDCFYIQESAEEEPGSMSNDVTSNQIELRTGPLALILQPTRELAIQCVKHLQAAAKYTDMKIISIVGGMAVQKQQRILRQKPEIIVATPGRLWELVEQNDPYLNHLDEVLSLVVDEADRMVEKGHFEELTKLLEIMNSNYEARKKRQTFLFSATLTMTLPGPQRTLSKKKNKLSTNNKLALLMKNIGMKEHAKVIDLTQKTGTVDTLTETRINCSLEDKDLYLYYFLSRYPGRTLVFTNSKDCIRRISSIFTLLKCDPLSLHSDMHQKQRLKNLEKFTASEKALLFASDVAARGLDIPNVQHVIHYQIPHTVETYVHRSGRTARASKAGLSVVLIGPDDMRNYKKIMNTLNRNEDLPGFPVESDFLPTLKAHLTLAKEIDTKEYRFNKKKHQNDWFLKAAREMDMELDDDQLLNDLGDDYQQSQHRAELKELRYELNGLLQQSVKSRHFSAKYPTKTGRLLTHKTLEDSKDAVTEVKENQQNRKRKRPIDVSKTKCNTVPMKKKQRKNKSKKKLKNR
ncbi:hypothetical protein ScPMuIL_006779 [Solemya velum]